jgi:hypothetical protein
MFMASLAFAEDAEVFKLSSAESCEQVIEGGTAKFIGEGANLLLNVKGFENFDNFKVLMHKGVVGVTDQLKRGEIESLWQILEKLAFVRRNIAFNLAHPVAGYFGQPRSGFPVAFTTHIKGRYSIFYEEAKNILVEKADRMFEQKQYLPTTGKPVQLTILLAISSDLKEIMWIHTSRSHIKPILEHTETLFKQLGRITYSRQEVIDKIAEIHWWLAHAMPFQRGSAAIIDAATKALFYAADIYPGNWKPGIVPDIKAFHTDLDTFIQNYSSYMETID